MQSGSERSTILIAILLGAASSLGLMLYAGRHNRSPVLIALFAVWVFSPFAALLCASMPSRRWTHQAGVALHAVAALLTLSSLAVYGLVAYGSVHLKVGAVFLMTPLASWVLIAMVGVVLRLRSWL
jgi:hypothetical protein